MRNLDTIKIKLQIKDYFVDEEGNSVQSKEVLDWDMDSRIIETVISINGEAIDHVADFHAFFTNSQDCRNRWDFEDGRKRSRYSAFYPFTCGCGSAGCAGIKEGIQTKHGKNIVKWKVKDKKTKRFLDKKYYSFDQALYEIQINSIVTWLEENKGELVCMEGDPYPVANELEFALKVWSKRFSDRT